MTGYLVPNFVITQDAFVEFNLVWPVPSVFRRDDCFTTIISQIYWVEETCSRLIQLTVYLIFWNILNKPEILTIKENETHLLIGQLNDFSKPLLFKCGDCTPPICSQTRDNSIHPKQNRYISQRHLLNILSQHIVPYQVY